MMIVSLFMITITIILATDEEQLAQVRLPYHTSILTGESWVMELLAEHPFHICTTLEVGYEMFIAMIDELCHTGYPNSKFVSLEEQLAIVPDK